MSRINRVDAIRHGVPKKNGLRVGFAHLLRRSAEECIDTILLDELDVSGNKRAPYRTEFPRHITSLTTVTIDRNNLACLDLGTRLGGLNNFAEEERQKIGNTIVDSSAGVEANRKKPISGTLVDLFVTGAGKTVGAVVDSPFASATKASITSTMQSIGVSIPLTREPHVTIGTTETKSDFNRLYAAAASLVGLEIGFEPVAPYFLTYTQTVEPKVVNVGDGATRITYRYI